MELWSIFMLYELDLFYRINLSFAKEYIVPGEIVAIKKGRSKDDFFPVLIVLFSCLKISL
jgi:hypothetical protein